MVKIMMRTTETIKAEIEKFFEENEDEFIEVIEDLDSYNGFLGDDRVYDMEYLSEFYTDCDPVEILTRAFYGYDDTYTDENGNHPEAFNPNRPYFYYNGYGNLVSCYEKDYSAHLDEWFVDAVIEHASDLNFPAEIEELIEELETIEDENE